MEHLRSEYFTLRIFYLIFLNKSVKLIFKISDNANMEDVEIPTRSGQGDKFEDTDQGDNSCGPFHSLVFI